MYDHKMKIFNRNGGKEFDNDPSNFCFVQNTFTFKNHAQTLLNKMGYLSKNIIIQ